MTQAEKHGRVLFVQPVPVQFLFAWLIPQYFPSVCISEHTGNSLHGNGFARNIIPFKGDSQKQPISHEEQWAETETPLCKGSMHFSDKGAWFTRFIRYGNPYSTLPRIWKNSHFLLKNPNERRISGKERHWLSNVHRYKYASIDTVVALTFEKAASSLTEGWKR